MRIQRHVRTDFQPVYIKLETLGEVKTLRKFIEDNKVDSDHLDIHELEQELTLIVNQKGVYP